MSETDIEEYISENADKTLRQLQAEIKDNFNVSKSLKWISKVRKKHETANPETEENNIEHAPKIIALKKKLRQRQLEKEIRKEEEEIEEIEELTERAKELESKNNLLKNDLEMITEVDSEIEKLRKTPCPTCAGKYITKVIGGYRCNLCGSYLKSPPLRRYI